MSAEALLPVYLLIGSDRPKIGRALRRLRARFGQESVDVLSADLTSGEDAVAAANALGLFASEGGRLVIVEGVERWSAADVAAVAAYLDAPVPGAVLALVADEPPKLPALAGACSRYGQVLEYNVPKPKEPSAWVRSEFARLGVQVDEGAARALVEIVGEDVTTLAAEAEKIATWAGDEPVGRREVAALAVSAREAAPWALTDAWGNRDTPGLLEACELALEHKEPFVLALGLASYVGRVRAAQALAEEGLGAREVAKRLRVHEFVARKALAHAENYSRDELDQAVLRLAALDAALKGASRLAGELELERALIDLTRPEPAARL